MMTPDITAMLAQIPADWTAPLAQLGVSGIVMGWFMFIITPQLKLIDRSQVWMAKSMLLLTVAIKSVPQSVTDEAHELMREIEQKTRKKDE